MAQVPAIGALWMDGPLSFLEQLCLVSFRDAGHQVTLFTYGDVPNIPEGIDEQDAGAILPDSHLRHARTGSPALHSDVFRYHLIAKNPGMIWADTDAYCVRPFETETGHFHAWESEYHVNGGVLGLPEDSETLHCLLKMTEDEYFMPEWYGSDYTAELEAARDSGDPLHVSEQRWGVWGPHAITHYLQKTGEIKYSMPRHALYPFLFKERGKMLRRGIPDSDYIKPDTYSIHFFGRRMRARILETQGGVPKRWSLIGRLLAKHGVNPLDAPIPDHTPGLAQNLPGTDQTIAATPPLQKTEPFMWKHDPNSRNLTDLADRYGTDKGSSKHRYTELYHMLLSPYTGRKVTFLEMGLQIGGPEHGKDQSRETTDLPSIRMWLDYFPKAQIIGLDVSDFSWFEHERFQFVQCDMDARANIEKAAEVADSFDIILDDASHASTHQQDAFLTLFPKLKKGGIYIIEDLRWQPPVYEKKYPGFTKTAALFQSFLENRAFSHSDPAYAEAFNALRDDISGAFVFQAQYVKAKKDQVLVVHKK